MYFLILASLAIGLGGEVVQAKHLGCYYGAWAYTRPGMGEFWPEDIDVSLCDVIYYGFGNILNDTFEVCSWDPWFDMGPPDFGETTIQNCIRERDGDKWPPGCVTVNGLEYCHHDGMRRTNALKKINPNLKVMFSVGGWTAGGKVYSDMAQTEATRLNFIRSTVHFLKRFGFDGMDLDWEFPALDMVPVEPTDPNDKYHFTFLMQELREAFDKEGFLLSFAASPDPAKAFNAYELDKVHQYVDWINVMTYDYGGLWDNFTGIDAPIYGRWEESFYGHPHYGFNMHATIQYYLGEGVPKEKIVLGVHTESKGFILHDLDNKGIYCPASGSPNMTFSRQEGWLNYYEILQFFYNETIEDPRWSDLKPGIENWFIFTDGCYKAPYAQQGQYWISYDDEESVDLKVRYANHHGLLGAFVWEIDTDNFMGMWNKPKYTITKAIAEALIKGDGLQDDEILGNAAQNQACEPKASLCEPPFVTTTAGPSTTTTPGECNIDGCDYDGILLAVEGDCHKYHKCTIEENGNCSLEEFTCGEMFFDPNTQSCAWEPLPGTELLCQ